MNDNQILSEILQELKEMRKELSHTQTGIALVVQTADTHAKLLTKHAEQIDDLRQAKWKLAGAVAALSGLASFIGSKFAHFFTSGTPPQH